MTAPTVTAPVSRRARAAFDGLEDKAYNFALRPRDEYLPREGWCVDDYRQLLPPESPGPPEPDGSWIACRRLLTSYAFADPRIVRAVYRADAPLAGRDMLLEGRFCGLRFRLGVRVGGVFDTVSDAGGRAVRRWGWNYRTLEGHLEMGQMDYEVRKWLDSGDVEFRIHAFSKPAPMRNPLIRLGFRVFGRRMQRKFAVRALQRMDRLVRAQLGANRRVGAPARGLAGGQP